MATQRAKVEKLKSLQPQQEEMWQKVLELSQIKKSNTYDQAVTLLVDLRDLAQWEGTLNVFQDKLKQYQIDHQKQHGLIRRLFEADLI